MKNLKSIKLNYLLILLMAMVFTLSACSGGGSTSPEIKDSNQTETNNETEKQEEKVTIILSEDSGEKILENKKVSIKDNEILMDVMQEHFELETDDNGTFINGINGIKAKKGEQKAWLYNVNGEQATVGASEYELQAGDKVEFDFQEWK